MRAVANRSPGLEYDGKTGELRYAGDGARDLTVRLERTDAPIASNPFRIRVLTPTHVYGDGAGAANREHRWGAKVCEPPMKFAACRKGSKGSGASDGAPLVVHITPGSYEGDFFLGNQRFVYVIGDPGNWPQLNRDSLAVARFERATFRNLALNSTRIGQQAARDDSPSSHAAVEHPPMGRDRGAKRCVESESSHASAVDRDGLELRRLRDGRSRQHRSSVLHRGPPAIDLRAQQRAHPRHARIERHQDDDAERGGAAQPAVGVGNTGRCDGWRPDAHAHRRPGGVEPGGLRQPLSSLSRTDAKNKPGRQGVLSAAIYLRLRKPGLKGSDIPAYPDLSWDPPRSSQTTMSAPGEGWSAGPETYVNDDFWKAVRKRPATDPANPLTFKHFVGFNRFEQLPGSRPITVLRDDGTRPAEPVTQFGPGRPLKVHPAWVERSVTFLAGNEFVGFGKRPLFELRSSEHMKEPAPGANWPRSKDEDFPHAVTLDGELPAWFRL